ncbi:MAG: tetratricopeptide repeat protein [Bacteroidales bacterium]
MAGNSHNPFHLWDELKQRKVVRVITVYTASAFAVLQAADMIFPRIGFPAWTITLLMILLAVGLLIAIVLSWVYDITPEGIKRSEDIDLGRTITQVAEAGLPSERLTDAGIYDEQLAIEKRAFADKIRKYKKKEKIFSFSSLVVILAVIVLFLFSSGKTVPFKKRGWILISDFENLTENSVFDKSLYTAFSLTINQSRYLNVFPRSRMIETLTMMKVKDPGYMDEKTGMEIATREGINILISPSISEIGNKFVISAKILETRTGNLLKSTILEADNLGRILPELDRLSKKIRRDLGESRYQISLQDKPLSKVTTSSLEALKQFSLGIEQHYKLDFAGAKTYYENALRIDTGFTSAKASLGNILLEKFGDEKGKELLGQAIRYVDNLTDKEKYGILAFYEINVQKDFRKGIETTRILTDKYPDDPAYHHNLGYYLQIDGHLAEAAEEYKKAVAINPRQALTYGGICWVYLEKLGIPDSAMVWSKKMISDNPQNAWGYFYLGSAYVCLDSLDKALNSFLKAREINPYFTMNQYRLAHTYYAQGKHKEAILILERIQEINKNEINQYYDLGLNYQAMGRTEEAGKYFRTFIDAATELWMKEYPDDTETYISLGVVYSRLDDTAAVQRMLRKALSIDSIPFNRYAELYCRMGKIPESLGLVEKALANGYRDLYWLKLDPDLLPLQKEETFRELLKRYFNQISTKPIP